MGVISNGTTLLDSGSFSSGLTGAMTLIKTLTASSSSTLSFVHGSSNVVLDGTYKEYIFKFINIHPSTDWNNHFAFQASTDGGSGYGVTVTNTAFRSYHNEAGTQTGLSYLDSYDQGQSTDFIRLCEDTSAANADENLSGEVRIFNPADTTFVKHYLGTSQTATAKVGQVYSLHWFGGGYFNTTSALNAFQFKFNSGNIDSGTIKLYGVT